MTSRERVLTALSHREPGRVPYDPGALGPGGISIQAYRNRLKFLQADERGETGGITSQRAKLSDSFLQTFRVDTRSIRVRPPASWSLNMQEEAGYSSIMAMRNALQRYGIYGTPQWAASDGGEAP